MNISHKLFQKKVSDRESQTENALRKAYLQKKKDKGDGNKSHSSQEDDELEFDVNQEETSKKNESRHEDDKVEVIQDSLPLDDTPEKVYFYDDEKRTV